MKLTGIILLTACLSAGARGHSQTVTLSLKNVPIQRVFKEVSKQTGISVVYRESFFKDFSPVTIQVKDVPIQEVFDKCFQDQPFEYSLEGKLIVVKKKPTGLFQPADSPSRPPQIDVHGRVTDSLGNPLAGASVVVKGTHQGTQTDADGNYHLTGVKDNAVLVISFTGFTPREFKLLGQLEYSIVLTRSTNPLDQVQIIAYGVTTKRLSTGDVSTVSAEAIGEQPVSSPLAALEGRVPGLVVTQQSGVAGGAFKVQIQGQNSITSGNDPLYIVDGIPYPSQPIVSSSMSGNIIYGANPISNIDPSSIQSIEILKDADATAIYGSRGANGVILITTKKGKIGKTQGHLNAYTGSGQASHLMPLLNTPQYLSMREEAFRNDGTVPDPAYDYDLTRWDTTRYTNWQKLLIGGTSHISDIESNISGGNENTQFMWGAGYHGESPVFQGDYIDQKISSHFQLTHNSFDKKFNLSLSVNYMSDKNLLPTYDFTNFTPPPPDTPPIYDSLGKFNYDQGTFSNIMGSTLQTYQINTQSLINSGMLSYQIIPGLLAKASFGYTTISADETEIFPADSFNPTFNYLSTSKFGNSSYTSWIMEPQLEYRRQVKKSSFVLLGGLTFLDNEHHTTTLNATGFSSDALLGNIAAATNVTVDNFTTYSSKYRYEALFARIQYNYADKYILNLNGRRDGSSRFAPGKQFANFGSVGGALIFSKEPGVQDLIPALSFGKLRMSYGLTGNDQIGDYQYLSTYYPTFYPYGTVAGLTPGRLLNTEYGWETVKKWETGLSLGFFQDRLMIDAAYFVNRSSNQLVGYSLPSITGFRQVIANLPAVVQNTGLEGEINSTNIKTADFLWSTSFNITVPHNKLIAYPDLANSSYAHTYKLGEPLSILPSLHYTGVDPATGIYTYQDLDHNGSSFDIPADVQFLKKIAIDYYGGLLNHFQYKRFKLDFFFQFVHQTGISYVSLYPTPGTKANQPTVVLDRWQKPGDEKPIQRYTQGGGSIDPLIAYLYSQFYGDNRIVNASFIRLKNLSFSYEFPLSGKHKEARPTVKLFLQGQNLLTITHFLGTDPENNGTNLLPPLRVLTAGLQINL